MTDQTALSVREYFDNPIIKSRFADVLGERGAGTYIASVLLAVSNNPDLRDCTMPSIYTSALRAATLRLSVDPATKQAYLVPFNSKHGKQATLIVGAKGLYDMAMRTGQYARIDVYKMFDGEGIEEDRITGTLKITGGRNSNKVTGWFGIFQFSPKFGGGSHYLYMTTDEIHAHAKKYSKGYDRQDGPWKTSTEAMEHKTILRLLLSKWGYLDPMDAATLAEVEEVEPEQADAETIEGEIEQPQTEPAPAEPRTEQQVMSELGFM